MPIQKRAIYFGVLLTGIGILSALLASYYMKRIINEFSDELGIGLSLFVIWLVLGSTIRTIYRLEDKISFFRLFVEGAITSILGISLAGLFKYLIEEIMEIELTNFDLGTETQVVYILVLSVFLSFFISLNVRMKSRFFGNLLEFLLIVLGLLGFVRFLGI